VLLADLAGSQDADLEHIDWEYGYTPLLWAARKGSAELIRFLLEEGADANASCAQGGNRGTTALMEATVWSTNSHPHIAAMKALLGDDGHPSTDINAKRGDGATALCLAAWVGNEPACRVLLEHKADPSIKYMGKTALQLARKGKHEALTAMLRDAGEAWRLKGLFRAASPSF
jgi:ankyrin repeat protein